MNALTKEQATKETLPLSRLPKKMTGVPYLIVAWPAKASVEGDSHYFFDILTAAVKAHLEPALQSGEANDKMYEQLNRDALVLADLKSSNHMWLHPAIPHHCYLQTFNKLTGARVGMHLRTYTHDITYAAVPLEPPSLFIYRLSV